MQQNVCLKTGKLVLPFSQEKQTLMMRRCLINHDLYYFVAKKEEAVLLTKLFEQKFCCKGNDPFDV